MMPLVFEETLSELRERCPFEPFVVELSSGSRIEVEHPELGDTITYAGAPLQMSHHRWGIRQRAPLIGEHNEEVYQAELGLSREEVAILKRDGTI